MKRRFVDHGLDNFAEHEVLELLLYYVYPRQDTNPIAHRFIKEFGSLANLLEADVKDIIKRLGVTENIAVLLSLMPPLANYYLRNRWDKNILLNDAETAGKFAASLFAGKITESLFLICLDKQRRSNFVSLIAEGTIDETAVYPRKIAEEAIRGQAVSVILAHNHPGGSARPSASDVEMTHRIAEGLSFIGITLLDHIIVSEDKYYSFAARGQAVAGY